MLQNSKMKEIVIISGKGGTGKTSIVASLAALAHNAVVADCDVDAADLHLIMKPKILHHEDFRAGYKAKIDPEICTSCGICYDLCRFDAVKKLDPAIEANNCEYEIDKIACEGCGVCSFFCPEKAIEMETPICGELFSSDTHFGPMAHARLGIAEENSGKLVTLVRNEAKKLAEETGIDYLFIDGSPGVGCPVIASLTGADLVLAVTEPTVAGRHDLKRIAELTRHFSIPMVVCINKCDLNQEISNEIENEALADGVKVIGKIRYDSAFTKAQIAGISVVEYSNNGVAEDIKQLWNQLEEKIEAL